jgi:DNA-directed RNA polymerase subunit M
MVPEGEVLRCPKPGCGHERGITEKDSGKVTTKAKEKSEILVLDEVTETLPRTHVDCPDCGAGEAFWVMRQTRAADEPATRIYRCVECSHTWREF